MVTGAARHQLLPAMRRAFEHGIMKEACKEVTKSSAGRLAGIMAGVSIPIQLQEVAQAFIRLQESRHEADYNMSRSFIRNDALDMVDLAEKAFVDWTAVRKSIPADIFLAALLTNRGMCR